MSDESEIAKLSADDFTPQKSPELDSVLKRAAEFIEEEMKEWLWDVDEETGERERRAIHISEMPHVKRDLMEAQNKAVSIINRKCCVLRNEGGKVMVLYDKAFDGEEEYRFQSIAEFAQSFTIKALSTVKVVGSGDDRECVLEYGFITKIWLGHQGRANAEAMTFDPTTEERFIDGYINLWRGFAIEPRKGSWRRMMRHIYIALADRDRDSFRYIVRWIAWTLQNPAEIAETAICFVGEQGTGKTTLGDAMMQIFGRHALRPNQGGHVTGKFNEQLRDKCFLLMDEALNPDSRAAANALKGLLTDKWTSYEGKGRRAERGRNRLKIIIASNNEHFVNVEVSDRRFVVFRTASSHRSDAYFRALKAELEQGGVAAMLHDLLKMKLTHTVNGQVVPWHPRDDIPNTEERKTQRQLSYTGATRLMFEALQDGAIPFFEVEGENEPKREGEESARSRKFLPRHWVLEWMNAFGDRELKSSVKDQKKIMAMIYPIGANFKTAPTVGGGERGQRAVRLREKRYRGERHKAVWVLPTLEAARAAFDAHNGPHSWDEGIEDWKPLSFDDYRAESFQKREAAEF